MPGDFEDGGWLSGLLALYDFPSVRIWRAFSRSVESMSCFWGGITWDFSPKGRDFAVRLRLYEVGCLCGFIPFESTRCSHDHALRNFKAT